MAEVIEIARHTLHDQVVVRLRAMLVEGRIVPGAKLNERELRELDGLLAQRGQSQGGGSAEQDPWAADTGAGGGYSDEPPF